MSIFKNKEKFADKTEIYNILTALEIAHEKQDALSCAILLTRLEQKNIKIIVDSNEENVVQ